MWPSCPAAWKSFTLYLLLGIVLACHHRRDYLVRSDSIICNPSMVNRHPASPHASLWRSVRFTIALQAVTSESVSKPPPPPPLRAGGQGQA